MQILIPKRTTLQQIVLAGFCFFLFSLWTSVWAIGMWVDGKVTRSPWRDDGIYLQVNKVTYKVMPECEILRVYTVDRSDYKEEIAISAIKKGNKLLLLAEGNRVYKIEKIDK